MSTQTHRDEIAPTSKPTAMTHAHFLKGESLDRLPVKTAEEIRLLPLDEIEFCRTDSGHIIIVTAAGEFRTGGSA